MMNAEMILVIGFIILVMWLFEKKLFKEDSKDVIDEIIDGDGILPMSPTDELINNMCLSYRHDFGLMTEKEQASLRFEAREWYRAIYSNIKTK